MMNVKLLCVFSAVTLVVVLLSSAIPQTAAQDTSFSYQLINLSDCTFSYTLNVVVPESLVEYYRGLNHVSASVGDFPKFVTPYAVKPIADCLRTIYPDDEDFANEVLTIVHQIPYEVITPAYYPVETMVRNSGDCDLFSLLAASILKAGGLEVVLLHFASEEHMNIGVHLSEPPQDARLPLFSVKSNSVTYYVAESTSTDWREGWRIGECPEDLKSAQVQIIPLSVISIIAPGQVSASFIKLDPTVLSLNVSPSFATEGSIITVAGQVSPAVPNQNVSLYFSTDESSWEIQNAIMTQPDGRFSYVWKSNSTGSLNVRASWSGNTQYAGTTSEAKSSIIIPFYLLGIIATAIIAISLCIIVFIRARKNRQKQNRKIEPIINPTTPAESNE
jgi:hypothetical protein